MRRPLQLALTYDEEVGCTGAPPMIADDAGASCPRRSAVIVGEPSRMRVVTGHKGGTGLQGPREGLRGAFLAAAIRASARSWRRRG